VMFHLLRCACLLTLCQALSAIAASAATPAESPADRIYQHGIVFTADAADTRAQAIAIRGGRIIYVGDDAGASAFVGAATVSVDLKGRFLMPGLVDGHMHPEEAGTTLLQCSLNYEALTVEQVQSRIQSCIEASKNKEPDAWLVIVNWFQEGMLPIGVKTNRATLDVLKTKRPIIVNSSFGHTVLANSRALALAKITAATPDPLGGKIWRDADGKPTGLLEDAAFDVFSTLVPKPTPAQGIKAAIVALRAMNAQGVTSFLDAHAYPLDLASFSTLSKTGKLTARAHMAPLIEPTEAGALDAAVSRIVGYRKQYDQGPIRPAPTVTVRNAKMFLDGVISAPAFTGSVLEPYRKNIGSAEQPRWVDGDNRGPPVYFPPAVLAKLLVALARAGIDPHMHADGDGAVHAALDAIGALREALPNADIRPAIAHDELVAQPDFARFKPLGAIPVLSFQWGKPAGDTLGLADYFGPERMRLLEPSGRLEAAGARIAFGSDWPVDALDEWFAFKVGVTRSNAPDSPVELRGRLGDDPGLSREAVLRDATINASYELHQDDVTGSLEVGKLADLIVLDRNPLTVPADDIAHVKVQETLVGGTVVYRAE
jgi:predicted amidohydrolase YtcJ